MEPKSVGNEEMSCSPTMETAKLTVNTRKFYGSNTSFSDSDIVEPLAFRLNQFRLKGIGCDIVFIVGEEREKFLVHKLVLGCSSPVFQAMFYGALGIASLRNNAIAILPTRAVSPVAGPKVAKETKKNDTTPAQTPTESDKQIPGSNELSERFLGISTRDDDEKQQKTAEDHQQLPYSIMFGDEDTMEGEDEEAVSDEEQYEEELSEDDLLCPASTVNGNLNDPSRIVDTTNASCAQNIFTNAADRLSNCDMPFYPHNSSFTTFPLADGSASPPVKLQRTNPSQPERLPSPLASSAGQPKGAENVKSVCRPVVSTSPMTTPIVCGSVAVEAIEVPDISPVAFGIMLDYIYNNYDVKCVELSDENVMHTLYAAKKYDLHSLVSECVRYLLNGLSPCNAVCLLAQARLFQEELLMRQCFEVIDKYTDVALQPANLVDVDRETLMEVLARSELDPSSEIVVFEAAWSWAEAECVRRGLSPTVDNLRDCLGVALQLIRFPLMSVQEFGEVAKLRLLTYEEIAEVYMHLTVKPRPFCRYPGGFRFGSRTKHIVNRFREMSTKRCSRRENKICFTADRDIFVSALGVYGLAPNSKSHIAYVNDKAPRDWSCQVEIQLASVTDPCTYGSSVCHSATNNVFVHGNTGDPTPCVAYFDAPVPCQANITYVASVRFISEVTTVQTFQTYQGVDGKDSITMELPCDDQTVTFKFQSYRNAYGSDEGGKVEGQIPAIHFLVQWPKEATKTAVEK